MALVVWLAVARREPLFTTSTTRAVETKEPHVEYKPLRRSLDNRVIAGVCGGVARFLGLDATLVRIGWVVIGILGGGLAAYMIAWFVLPDDLEQRSSVPILLLILLFVIPFTCFLCSIPFMAMDSR
jgi:phage shock protein PspC (stress-responsive transcriptional regulator)